MIFYLITITIISLVIYVISIYNKIIRTKNEIDKAFGSIDAMLKKRYDLIPNLVETVKQYGSYEASVLTEITRIREQISGEHTVDEKVKLHNDLSKQLQGVMVSVENYPNLKASQNYLQLQAAWNEAEEQISAARRYYNAAVVEYNNAIQTFPANILIDSSKFNVKSVLEIEETERKNISAKDLFNSK